MSDKPKYYCHLNEGKTKGDNLDIHTLHYISNMVSKLIMMNYERFLVGDPVSDSFADIHGHATDWAYRDVLRITSDVLNREIGT